MLPSSPVAARVLLRIISFYIYHHCLRLLFLPIFIMFSQRRKVAAFPASPNHSCYLSCFGFSIEPPNRMHNKIPRANMCAPYRFYASFWLIGDENVNIIKGINGKTDERRRIGLGWTGEVGDSEECTDDVWGHGAHGDINDHVCERSFVQIFWNEFNHELQCWPQKLQWWNGGREKMQAPERGAVLTYKTYLIIALMGDEFCLCY